MSKNWKPLKNNKHGLYDGPGGIIYDAEHHEVFFLEWEGLERVNVKTGKIVGRTYRFHGKSDGKIVKRAKVGVTLNDHCFRLGDYETPPRRPVAHQGPDPDSYLY